MEARFQTKSQTPKATIVRITPQMAREWLKLNTENRKIYKSHINSVESAMIKQQFSLNGETIIFAKDGRLLDGQYRLTSAVNTNTTFESFVVTGIDGSLFDTIDQGKSRSVSDFLSMRNVPNSTTTASMINKFVALKKNFSVTGRSVPNKELGLTKRDLLDMYNEKSELWDDIANFSRGLYRKRRLFSAAYLGSNIAYLITEKKHKKETVYRFFDQLISNENVENSTISVLHYKLVDSAISGYKMTENYKHALLTKTFNCFITGKELKILKFSVGNEDYPQYV